MAAAVGEHTKLNLSKLLLRMQLRKYTFKLSAKFSKHYRVSLCCWVWSSAGAGRQAGWLAGAKVPRCRTARRTPSRVAPMWSWPLAVCGYEVVGFGATAWFVTKYMLVVRTEGVEARWSMFCYRNLHWNAVRRGSAAKAPASQSLHLTQGILEDRLCRSHPVD